MIEIVEPSVTLMRVTPDADLLIESAARVCYKSEDKIAPGTAAQLIKKVIELGHESVLEHASATFRIVCDRGISHELVRHRIASYSQESTRYCDYRGAIQVVRPVGVTEEVFATWYTSCLASVVSYRELRVAGVPPQVARSVLPTCLKTEIVMTANFREWRHLIKLRDAPPAHPDMRVIARQIHTSLQAIFPEGFSHGT